MSRKRFELGKGPRVLTRDQVRGSPQPGAVLMTAAIALPLLLFALAAWQSHRATLADARSQVERTTRILQEHASKVLDTQHLVVEQIRDYLRANDGSRGDNLLGLHQLLARLQAETEQVTTIAVTDAAGGMRASARVYPADPKMGFADREWFQAIKNGDSRTTYVSKPIIGRQTGRRVFMVTVQAPRDRSGRFDGAISASIDQGYFQAFYRDIEPVADHSITLAREDGAILAREPPTEQTDLGTSPDMVRSMQTGSSGSYTAVSPIDGIERIYAYRKIAGYPIYVRFGVSTRAALAPWHGTLVTYGAAAALASFALVAASALALRQTARAAAARRRGAAPAADLQCEIAERARVEDQLRQSQKLEAVGQLTGGVAHDFNNLLTVIRFSTDLLKRPNLGEERRARYVEAISDTVDRAAKLTGQLLAFARRQALRPQVIDAGRGVQAVGDMLGTLTGSRIDCVMLVPEQACFVDVDASQFDTALVNMAVNARDAMDGEGRLTIRVEPVDGIPAVRAHPPRTGPFVAVSVTDTGTGITPDTLRRVFEPFFTTKAVGQGTGLGLSQVFGFAKQSGGEVTVASEVGRGTTFTLYLPRVAAAAPEPVRAEPEPPASGHGARVLVVEDNADVGTFATQVLAELGYVTTLATSGQQALRELEAASAGFDAVFSDVVMPGIDGIELAREIHSRHPDLPIVLTSGYSHVLAQDGVSEYALLRKPYSVEQLSRVLGEVAVRRGLGRQGRGRQVIAGS